MQSLSAETSNLIEALRSLNPTATGETSGGKVVPLPLATPEPAGAASSGRDWTSAIELVNEARQAIRIGEERARTLEAEVKQLTNEAAEEIRKLQQELQQRTRELEESQRREAALEKRAAEAELRATDAEAWLGRLHDSVIDAFKPLVGQAAPSLLRSVPQTGTTG
jgi:chromosome segregation ATPase